MVCPVTYADSSETRNSTHFATSDGWANRPSGMVLRYRGASPGLCTTSSASGVSTTPGATPFARIPRAARSMAADRTRAGVAVEGDDAGAFVEERGHDREADALRRAGDDHTLFPVNRPIRRAGPLSPGSR